MLQQNIDNGIGIWNEIVADKTVNDEQRAAFCFWRINSI